MHHRHSESTARRREIGNIVRHQSIGVAVDGRLQDHLIIRISKLRPPSKMQIDRLDEGGKLRQEFVDLVQRKSVREALLGPLQDLFVLQKEWRTRTGVFVRRSYADVPACKREVEN